MTKYFANVETQRRLPPPDVDRTSSSRRPSKRWLGLVRKHAAFVLIVLLPTLFGFALTPEGKQTLPTFRAIVAWDNRMDALPNVMAFNANLGQFYGVQGTTWKQAPILASPQEIRYVGGKRLELHYDGHSLRLVAWRTGQAVYWVSNTLSLNLSNQQMLGMAASLTRAG